MTTKPPATSVTQAPSNSSPPNSTNNSSATHPTTLLSKVRTISHSIWAGLQASILDLTKWLIFSVAMVLLPLVIFHLEEKASLEGIMESLMQGGNLLIIAIAIIGEGLSEIFTMSKTSPVSRILVGGIGLVLMVTASMLISNFRGTNEPSSNIQEISVTIFWASLAIGGLCKVIKETN